MIRLNFTIKIEAAREKVWNILWNEFTYSKWTSPFGEGSRALSDWHEGSKVLFLAASGEGMYSSIEKMIPNNIMEFKHLGSVKDGKEEPVDADANEWYGSMENYILTENSGMTELEVEIDAVDEYVDFFKKAFPEALQKVKELAEN